MPWNGSGTYSPPAATFPEVNGTVIDADRYNPTLNDIASGVTNCLAKDGQNTPTANLPMGGFRHTGALAAAASGQYLVYGQSAGSITSISFALGTAAAPSIYPGSDTNTGIWSAGADQLSFATGGINRFNIASTVVEVLPTTAATSPTTGALTVAGGVGVAGQLWVGNTSVIQSTAPEQRFYEADQVLPAGRYRWLLDGNIFRLQYNTAVAGDFSAVSTPLYYNPSVTTLVLGAATDQVRTLGAAHQFADGTVSLPAITWASDLDTGFYWPGANQLGVTVGGTEIAKFSSTALTIGTGGNTLQLSPSSTGNYRLDAYDATGTINYDLNPIPADGTSAVRLGVFRYTSTSGTRLFQVFRGDNTSTYDHSLAAGSSGLLADLCRNGGQVGVPAGTAAAPSYSLASDLDTGIYSPGANSLGVAAGGTLRLSLDTAAVTSTLPIVHPLATAAAPAVTFTGDLDTGVYSPGANRIGIATAGLQRFEVDSSGYGSMNVNGLGAGRVVATQMFRLNAALAGANVTTAQNVLGVGVTLVGSMVYEFELVFALEKSVGATNHNISLLFGGTATLNNILYEVYGNGDATALPMIDEANIRYGVSNSAAAIAARVSISATTTSTVVRARGNVSINAGGTFIPQYQLSAAPGGAYSTVAGSYMRIWPLGASGADTNIGTWA